MLDSDIVRPLLDMSKDEIIAYANEHGLEWREDSTNMSDAYLRNRIRVKAQPMQDDTKRQLLALRAQQVATKQHIDQEVRALVGDGPDYGRYFFTHAEPAAAMECLRFITAARLTRPQLGRTLMAIKTAKPGSVYQPGSAVTLSFTSRNFKVELIK